MNSETTYDTDSVVLDDQLTFRDMLGVLAENRRLIAGTVLITFCLGLAYSFFAAPVYEADGLVQVDEKNSNLVTLDANGLFEVDTTINAEIEIFLSRLVLGPVVDELNLDVSAEASFLPIIGGMLDRRRDESERKTIRISQSEIPDSLIEQQLTLVAGIARRYELFSPDGDKILNGVVGEMTSGIHRGDALSLTILELGAQEGDEFTITRHYRLTQIEKLKSSLRIKEQGNGSGILELNLEGSSPQDVRQRLNAIIKSYIDQNKNRKTSDAETTLEFLGTQLPTVKQNMEEAETALNDYRLGKGSVDLPLETQAILETIVSVEGQRNQLELERVNVIQGYTTEHPSVIAIDEQLNQLSEELSKLSGRVRELPNTQQEVLRLVRDVEVNTELYTSLLNTAQELRVIKAGTVGNARIVDTAVTPLNPIKPRKGRVLLASLIIGVFIGIGLAFAKRALKSGVEDPEVIERRINLPVYATILRSKRQDQLVNKSISGSSDLRLLALQNPSDPAIETIKNIRTAMHFTMKNAKNNCIMIAGLTPGVGTSFVSANLAAILATNGKKVLLIDGDMRRGCLHQYFETNREGGLSEAINVEIPLGQALRQTKVDGLSLISAGKSVADPTELLLNNRFAQSLEELADAFDHVIVDSPAILAVTDAAIIGQACASAMMVLKSAAHPMREIELGVKRLKQVGVSLSGIIINDVSPESRHHSAGEYAFSSS